MPRFILLVLALYLNWVCKICKTHLNYPIIKPQITAYLSFKKKKKTLKVHFNFNSHSIWLPKKQRKRNLDVKSFSLIALYVNWVCKIFKTHLNYPIIKPKKLLNYCLSLISHLHKKSFEVHFYYNFPEPKQSKITL